ncbi:phosphatase PAP2 family protein [Candidatus Pacearchaeota archaeon]|nr:phosphatase PAP2 family protein [Candidatus Pacearchaeota archaeon]
MENQGISRGLRSSGFLGKNPIIGLMMFIFGTLIFTIIAYNLVNQGSLIQWDLPLAKYFHALALNSSPLVINVMIAGYYIGSGLIWAGAIILSLYFLYKRFWRELVMTVVSLGFSGLLFLSLSNIFDRSRPSILFDELIWASNLTIPGFPSGHAKSILVLCGFLVYLFLPKIKSYMGKISLVLVASLFVIYVGFSRIYIGDHYLSDVIAGYAVGIAWFGLSYTAIEALFQKYQVKKEKSHYEKNNK